MRRITICTLLVFLSLASFSQGWQLISPLPTFRDLNGISFPVLDTGFVCDNVNIYRTYDGGLNWHTLYLQGDNYEYIRNVKFISANKGFALRANSIYMTTDAGESWEKGNQEFSGSKIYFLDELRGYVYGGVIYMTDNGGLSWDYLYNSYGSKIIDLEFFNPDTGFCVSYNENEGEHVLKQTIDGGSSWLEVTTPVEPHSISLLGVSEIWLGGTRFAGYQTVPLYVYHSADGGLTWDSVYVAQSDYTPQSINEIHFFNNLEGYACHKSIIYTTIDGGNSWTVSNVSSTYPNNCLITGYSYSDPLHGYYCGKGGGLAKTSDRGATFSRMATGLNHNWGDTYWFDMNRVVSAIATPWDPLMMYSNDGAVTWDTCNITGESMGSITDIEFADDNYGWASCENGLYASNDGGMNWEPRYIDMQWQIMFNDISTPSLNHIYNKNGSTLFYSSDQGYSWIDRSPQEYQNDMDGAALCFPDTLIGYFALKNRISGRQILIKTLDGGETWSQIAEFDQTDPITMMAFYDAENGVLSGGLNVMVTNNGGLTWNNYTNWPTSYVKMFDPQTVLLAIGSQYILLSYDGGLNYTIVYDGYMDMFTSNIRFPVDPDHGYAMGRYGMIMKYDVNYTGVKSPDSVSNSSVTPFFYPNPAGSTIRLSEVCGSSIITIYSIEGRPLLTTSVSSNCEVDISTLPPGMYFVAINGSGWRVGKLVKI